MNVKVAIDLRSIVNFQISSRISLGSELHVNLQLIQCEEVAVGRPKLECLLVVLTGIAKVSSFPSNSASASRLSDIAHILHIQVGDFFRDFGSMQHEDWVNLQANREQLLLARYFNQIRNPEKRQAISHLLRMLSDFPAA